MIVWINGAFGVGKSQAAFELARRTERSTLCDPEQVGFGLHRMTPRELRGDFQDLPAWRVGVRDRLAAVDSSGRYDLVVVPMTLVRAYYRTEILDALTAEGHDVRHAVLAASPGTVRRRLAGRGAHVPGLRDEWALSRIDECVAALADDEVTGPATVRVPTDGLSHDEVVEAVARAVDVELVRPRRGPLGRRAQTLVNQVRVIRL